jgi:hypothetical protein
MTEEFTFEEKHCFDCLEVFENLSKKGCDCDLCDNCFDKFRL